MYKAKLLIALPLISIASASEAASFEFAYARSGDSILASTLVFNDGKHTYLQPRVQGDVTIRVHDGVRFAQIEASRDGQYVRIPGVPKQIQITQAERTGELTHIPKAPAVTQAGVTASGKTVSQTSMTIDAPAATEPTKLAAVTEGDAAKSVQKTAVSIAQESPPERRMKVLRDQRLSHAIRAFVAQEGFTLDWEAGAGDYINLVEYEVIGKDMPAVLRAVLSQHGLRAAVHYANHAIYITR
jgi:hypothetical protein